MYANGEGLQWYDPALLFPSCPLSSTGDEDGVDFDRDTARSPSFTQDPSLPPAALQRRVRQRARELLLERLTHDTLSSDRDASASIAALVKSLHTGQPVQPTDHVKVPADPTGTRGGSSALHLLPTSLSGTRTQQQQHHHRHGAGGGRGVLSPLHPLSTGGTGGGDLSSELWNSDGEQGEFESAEDDVAGFSSGEDAEDDYDDFAFGGRGTSNATTAASAAELRQARDLRAHFASLPARVGVQEEPVLCPLNLPSDPLTHVVASAEVFAVVTSTLPQVLYVFDQLNNVPISFSALGGATFTAGGEVATSSLRQPFAGTQRSAAGAEHTAAAAAAAGSSACVVTCTIDVSDTVQQLWMDHTGYYCVLVFASGKCVYFHLPRRPSHAIAGANGDGDAAAAAGTRSAAEDNDSGASDSESGADRQQQQKRRQERHREWKAAARRWLRFRSRRRSHSGSNDDGGAEGGAENAAVMDSDAAFRPRGFSLTCTVSPHLLSSRDLEGGDGAAAVGFVPSCVGWPRYISPSCTGAAPPAATAATAAAAPPRGILKRGQRSGSSNATAAAAAHGAASTSHLAFKMNAADRVAAAATRRTPSSLPRAEVLLGARRGGCLLGCLLTPTGAAGTRVIVAGLPSPIADSSIDSVVAICARAAPGDKSTAEGSAGGNGDTAQHKTTTTLRGESSSLPSHQDYHRDGSTASTATFPSYAHTAQFFPADKERWGGEAGPPAAAAAVDGSPLGGASIMEKRDDRRGGGSCNALCPRWVVLMSVGNRLYVFSTPSAATDFSELEELRQSAVTAAAAQRGAAHMGLSPLRGARSSGVRRLTGRVEDSFLLLSSATAPNEDIPVNSASRFAKSTAVAAANTSPPTAEKLQNFITVEASALSVLSRGGGGGYTAAASQVRTTAPDEAAAEEARLTASVIGSATSTSTAAAAVARGTASPPPQQSVFPAARGVVHLVLPPLNSAPGNDTNSGGGDLATAAALPPVFYWQYGDVVVQGLVLCGAGGLEVGAKVRSLVDQEEEAEAETPSAARTTPVPSCVRRAGEGRSSGVLKRDAVMPMGVPARRPASGLEAGLSTLVDEALRETENLNTFADSHTAPPTQQHDPHAAVSGAPFTTETGAAALRSTAAETAAIPKSVVADTTTTPTPITASSIFGAQTTVLPIGVLSVVNVNSCLQSLRGLLALMGSASYGDRQDRSHGSRQRGLTYTRSTLSPSSQMPYCSSATMAAAAVAANPAGVSHAFDGAFTVLLAQEEAETAALRTSLTDALRHPALQFPFTPHLVASSGAVQQRGASAGTARKQGEALGGRSGERHGQQHHHSHREPALVAGNFNTTTAASVDTGASWRDQERRKKSRDKRFRRTTSRPRVLVDVPLLSAALARGDVDAGMLHRLRTVARAYIRCSPVLFGAPVADALRSSAAALAAAAAESIASPTFGALQAATGSAGALSPRPWSPHPLCASPRDTAMHGLLDAPEGEDADGTHTHSRTSSAALSLPRTTTSVFASTFHESGGRSRGHEAGTTGNKHGVARATAATTPPLTRSGEHGVALEEGGEVLVSLAASYTHLTLTTTQGVYVLAHAAVAPWEESALSWRRALAYHAITTPAVAAAAGGAAASSPSAATRVRGPLFTAVADAAAPGIAYLASRTRMARLQAPSLETTVAGRKQFVVQLLALASATATQQQHAAGQEAAFPTSPAPAQHRDVPESGGDVRTNVSAGQRITAALSSSSNGGGGNGVSLTAISLVVPSSLSYEVRLRGWLRGRAPLSDIDDDTEEEEAERVSVLRATRRHVSPHETNTATSAVGDVDARSRRSSQELRLSSAQRRHPFPTSVAGASSHGTRSDAGSWHALPPWAAQLTRLEESLEQPSPAPETAAVTASTAAAGAPVATLPRVESSVAAVSSQRVLPVTAAAHFLRHANRRALLQLRVQSAVSLSHEDSPDLPFIDKHAHAQQQQQQQGDVFPPSVNLPSVVSATRAGAQRRGADVVTLLPSPILTTATRLEAMSLAPTSSASHGVTLLYPGPASPGREGRMTAAVTTTLPRQASATFTNYASPPHVGSSNSTSHRSDQRGALATRQAPSADTLDTFLRHANSKTPTPAAAVAAPEATSKAEDRELATFLSANPLLHFLLQRSGTAHVERSISEGNNNNTSATAGGGGIRSGRHRKTLAAITTTTNSSRAVNIPGFGVLPGTVGLTPLAPTSSRAVAILLLQMPLGASYYAPDHLYEMALAAACAGRTGAPSANATLSSTVMVREDVCLVYLVRHTYGGYLLKQHRPLEAAVQFGKAPDGPTPFTTVVTEMVRAYRTSHSLEPLLLLLRLRLRAWETSAKGLGGHGMEVSVLATWLLSLCLEQCSIARAQRRRYKTVPVKGGTKEIRGTSSLPTHGTTCTAPATGEGDVGGARDYTRAAWIRHRYHLHHPHALLEDTLLRYGRFVDRTVLATTVARLASAHEAMLVSELQGMPEQTVMGLVLREHNLFAALLRLQALLVDPDSHAPQTQHLLHTLIHAEEKEDGDGGESAGRIDSAEGAAAAVDASAGGITPLMTVFYKSGTSPTLLPPPRDASSLPRTLAALFERLSTLFLSCYPCRYVQEGLLVLLHQRQDVPLPPRRLLPALLTYTTACNESDFEASEHPSVVLQTLAASRQAQCVPLTYAVGSRTKGRRNKPKERTVQRGKKGHSTASGEAAPAVAPTVPGGRRRGEEAEGDGRKADAKNRSASSSTDADSLLLSPRASSAAAAAAAAEAPSLAASTPSSSRRASQHETRAYELNELSLVDDGGAVRPSPAAGEGGVEDDYDIVLLDDSTNSDHHGDGEGIDEDILLSPPPISRAGVTPLVAAANTSTSSSSSSTGSTDTTTPSFPRQRESRLHAGNGTGVDKAGGVSSHLLSDSRRSSSSSPFSTATSKSVTERRDVDHRTVSSPSRDVGLTSPHPHLPPAAAAAIALHMANHLAPRASTATTTTNASSLSSADSVAEDLLATSTSSSDALTAKSRGNDYDSDEGLSSGSDMAVYSPFMGCGVGDGDDDVAGGDGGYMTEEEARATARMQRVRQKRLDAARRLRLVLTPALSRDVVAAAMAIGEVQSHGATDRMAEGSSQLLLQPVQEHAVLTYLKEIVVLWGASTSQPSDDADVAVFVTYANILARFGEEEALQRFSEQLAHQHTQWTDTQRFADTACLSSSSPPSAAAATSFYRLLHVLRLCTAHHRWVGCVWMYYALGYYREAVSLALRYVVSEEGVRLAVRLLQLLQERDSHRQPHRGGTLSTQQLRLGRRRSSINPSAEGVPGANCAAQQEVRRSRRELWMLVARHLIDGGGHTKRGAQTALQLSLRSGGDAFNVTDVLPELPGSLFMAELKVELLSSVRELSHRMRQLRGSTNALGRDTRVLHREVDALANEPLSMQAEERCVVCGQPALARPFTVYPRCRHLIHTSCYHHARQMTLLREHPVDALTLLPQPPSVTRRDLRGGGGSGGARRTSQPVADTADTQGDCVTETSADVVDSMECLLCARSYLRAVLDAPLHVPLIGDEAHLSQQRRVVLR